MDEIEAIVLEDTGMEGKETVVSSADADKAKAGWLNVSHQVSA